LNTASVALDAIEYLRPPNGSFWKWTDDGGAIEWFDGDTIVFTVELLKILEHQAVTGARGLPPLGAVILLVAATRENWSSTASNSSISLRTERLKEFCENYTTADILDNVLKGLDKVHALETDVRLSLESKQWIVEFVFTHSPRTTVAIGQEVLRVLGDLDEVFWTSQPHQPSTRAKQKFYESFEVLNAKINDVTSEKLRLLCEAGIEEIPIVVEEDELEFPEFDSIANLIRDLHSDQEFYGLARAAQQLMSVMSLPRPMLRENKIEQGGFSDIANRGSLDRLLLSELAYDDLTLAVRVAVNEAMYLRRESPPNNSQQQRIVLLDSGLRMWGVPRFLGTSVALAFAGQAQASNGQTENPFTAYTASGTELTAIDLSQRRGIVAHLKTLRPELDPRASFPQLETSLCEFEETPEVVVVTSPEALSDPEFRSSITHVAIQNPGSYFVVTVARNGETHLHEITRAGCKPLQKMKFDLEKVFSNPPISDKQSASKLPAIYGVEPFPLRLPYFFKGPPTVWTLGTEMVMAITRDARLMLSTDSQRGAIQLLPHIKRGKHWWSSREAIASNWYSIVGNSQTNQFQLIRFHEQDFTVELTTLQLSEPPEAFCNHGDTLFFIGKSHVSIIDKSTGMPSLNRISLEDKVHSRGRYFVTFPGVSDPNRYALSTNGLAPTFELLPPAPEAVNSQPCVLFDSTSVEGTVGMFDGGQHYFWATDELVSDIYKSDHTSLDHERDFQYQLTNETDKREQFPTFTRRQIRKLVGQKQLRTRFLSIGIYDGKVLSLESHNQTRVDIKIVHDHICMRPTYESGVQHSKIRFRGIQTNKLQGFELKEATWRDGSNAWLDSRGLLHLKSSDKSLPELTIVLTDDPLGGWLSTGQVWGAAFFQPPDSMLRASNQQVMDIITKFTINIISRC